MTRTILTKIYALSTRIIKEKSKETHKFKKKLTNSVFTIVDDLTSNFQKEETNNLSLSWEKKKDQGIEKRRDIAQTDETGR